MRTGHLFAGAGGGLYADLILGHTPVFAVEWDDYAAAVLRDRVADGWFPDLSVWHGDVELFDTSEWEGRVDSIHAGFPCTDISVAGAGAGIEGERSGLWREVARIAGEIRPSELFLENSPAITTRGLQRVLGDLAELGYDTRYGVLSAANVGAPHRRARWWCLARRTNANGTARREETDRRKERKQIGGKIRDEHSPICEIHDTNADSLRSTEQEREHQRPKDMHRSCDWTVEPSMADTDNTEQHPDSRGRRSSEPQETRDNAGWSGGNMANANSERGPCGNTERQNAENAGESSIGQGHNSSGVGWWGAEPGVGRVVNGLAARGNQIKCLGNGQVPLQAAAAYKILDGMYQ